MALNGLNKFLKDKLKYMINVNKLRIVSISYKCRAYRKNDDIIQEVRCYITYYNPILGTNKRSIGIARCDPNDVYYYDIGKHIAESRAKANMYRNYTSFLKKVRQALSCSITKHEELTKREKCHIGDLIIDTKEK